MLLRLLTTMCFVASSANANGINVVTDIKPVHSLAASLMKGISDPFLILEGEDNPHHYSLTPKQAKAIQDADLVFWVGEGLTPWLTRPLKNLSADSKQIAVLELGIKLPVREDFLFDSHENDGHEGDDRSDEHAEDGHNEDKHDDEHGEDEHKEAKHDDEHEEDGHEEEGHHGHSGTDPHAWLDPENVMIWVWEMGRGLASADPQNTVQYAQNTSDLIAELEALSNEIKVLIEPMKSNAVFVQHDSFQYFEKRYDLNVVGALHDNEDANPSSSRIRKAEKLVVSENVTCLVAQPFSNTKLLDILYDPNVMKKVAIDQIGVDLEPGPEMYSKLLRQIANSYAECAG